MTAEERNELIYSSLDEGKALTINQMAEATKTSKENVRIAIRRLEETGRISRKWQFNNKLTFKQSISPKQLLSVKWTPGELTLN